MAGELILSDDRELLTIKLNESFQIECTAPGLDAFIDALQAQRAEMKPAVPETRSAGTVRALFGAQWCTENEKLGEDVLLHFRHIGLGWLTFAFSKDQAQSLAQELAARASQQSDTPSKHN